MSGIAHEDRNVTMEARPVDVRLFGAFRQYGREATVRVRVREGACVRDVRAALGAHLGANADALMDASVFATNERMLRDDESVPAGELSVLPPVCGG